MPNQILNIFSSDLTKFCTYFFLEKLPASGGFCPVPLARNGALSLDPVGRLPSPDSWVSVASTKVRGTHGEREARANDGGLGADPPAESRGRAPGHGLRGRSPSEAKSFTTFGRPTEAITFMSFAIFCKLGTPNIGYTQYPDRT